MSEESIYRDIKEADMRAEAEEIIKQQKQQPNPDVDIINEMRKQEAITMKPGNRPMSITAYVEVVQQRAEAICTEFANFTDGPRMIILLQREKEGGSHDEDRRMLCSRFTFSPNHFKKALTELLLIKVMHPTARIYSSVNPRDLRKVVRTIETDLLNTHYSNDEVNQMNVYKKLISAPRHFFMQPQNRDGSLFLIDVDKEEGVTDTLAEPLRLIAELNIDIHMVYKTKNGYHIITAPFNPALWTHKSEIKKDALLLLDY